MDTTFIVQGSLCLPVLITIATHMDEPSLIAKAVSVGCAVSFQSNLSHPVFSPGFDA